MLLWLPQRLTNYVRSFGFTLCFRQEFPFSFLDSLELSDQWLLWQGLLSVMNPFRLLSDILMKISFRVSTSVCWGGKNIWAEVFCLQVITVGFQWPNPFLVSEHSCHLGTSLLPKYTSRLSYYCHYKKFTRLLCLHSFGHEDRDRLVLTQLQVGKQVLSILSSTAK